MNKYIIFDIDNTLVENFEKSYKIFYDIGKENGLKIDKQIFLENYKKGSFFNNYNYFFGKIISFKNFNKIYENKKNKIGEKIYFNKNILFVLKNKGYGIGILTNGPKDKTMSKLAKLGIVRDLLFIITGDDLGKNKKPSPKAFDKVKEKIGENSEIIYVGDSLEDYYSAKGAGVEFYGVLTGFTKKEEFLQNGLEENKILNSVNELGQKIFD